VVLVADDEPTMLELLARHLRTLEHPRVEVIEASDGTEAWRLATERLPDLVVLDVMMPGMSGWEVCRKIRQDAALAHTGVLMLTGIGTNLNEATSPLFGADAFIDKPFEFDELDQKIESILKHRAAQRDAVPRPVGGRLASTKRIGNGVDPSAPAASTSGTLSSAPRNPKGAKGRVTKHKQRNIGNTHKKGMKTMAAKKKAKKTAKKSAKKTAKKAKRK